MRESRGIALGGELDVGRQGTGPGSSKTGWVVARRKCRCVCGGRRGKILEGKVWRRVTGTKRGWAVTRPGVGLDL
jgi:hypothetical protein